MRKIAVTAFLLLISSAFAAAQVPTSGNVFFGYSYYNANVGGQRTSLNGWNGSIEGKFYAELLRLSGLEGEKLPRQNDRAQWPAFQERLNALFKTKTRDEWCAIMEGSEVCFAPVLNMREAPAHPHNRHRGTFVEMDGVVQPAPAPRFARTPSKIQRPPARPGEHTEEALRDWGVSAADLERLRASGAIGVRDANAKAAAGR